MSENTEQSDQNDAPDFSDEAIRRFLLGSLNAAEQSTFEAQLFVDGRLETRVRLMECELADDYAFERLSAADRELFQQRFLVSAARQQQVTVSSALRDRFATMPQASTPAPSVRTTIGKNLQRLLGLNQPSWKLALRVAILILLVGTMWTVLRGPKVRQFIGRRRPAPAVTPIPNRQEANHPTKASPTPSQQQAPVPFGLDPDADPVTIVLFPRHGYDPIRITQVGFPDRAHSTLHLLLSFSEDPELFRAELSTLGGRPVFEESPLRLISVGLIALDVPARVLDAGDYQVKLRPAAGGTEVATYYFRVQ